MIVPMKKAAVIVQSKDADAAVRKMRSLGVLHVEHQVYPKAKEMADIRDDAALVESALRFIALERPITGEALEEKKELSNWKGIATHIVESWKRLDQLEEYSRSLRIGIGEWERWGDFNPDDIEALSKNGINVKFYEIPEKKLKDLPAGIVIRKIYNTGNVAHCAAISRQRLDLAYREVHPPRMSLAKMRSRFAEDLHTIEHIKHDLREHTRYLGALQEVKCRLEKELEFTEVIKGMGSDGTIMYLTGYIPNDAAALLTETAKKERWAILITDPGEADTIPTLMRNPKWVSLIEPVFKFLEIVPGYKELDISPLFLLFLSLFFGMIIGDAGYGLLYIALTAFAQKKMGARMKDHKVFFLLYLFSSSAVLWGVLTGTVFGQEWYLKAGLKPLLPILNDTKFLQAFCFGLGAVHLTLGHGWQALRKLPSITALADAGWILVLWASFFLARTLILSYPLPGFTNWLIIAGVCLVIFFTNPQKNILKTVGAGLGSVALSIMNNFTDVVSYVRLFAVGLAGVAISDTVNALAATFGGSSVIVQILIIFLGHTINIVLGPISVLVHGVRLNVLEFSGHAGLSWSGTPYKPLKS